MQYRRLGSTGLRVSVLGLGAGHLGSDALTEDEAGTLLNRALDRGINFVDTARSYGLSEARIGRHLSWRRRDFLLATKVGYGVEGVADWTGNAVLRGTEEALRTLQTDCIDVVLLHSCPREVLQREEVQRALEDLPRKGYARHTGYAGDNDALEFALTLPSVEVVETSLNLTDQGNLDGRFGRLKGRGVIAKRPLANAFWTFLEQPRGEYCEPYWLRWSALGLSSDDFSLPMEELAFRFVTAVPEVSTAIVGTRRLSRLEHNLSLGALPPLESKHFERLRSRWKQYGEHWDGQV